MERLFFIGKKQKEIEIKSKEKGYSKVYFIKEINSINEKEYLDYKEYNSCVLNIENLEILRRAIDKASHKFEGIFVLGINDQINRIALENKKVLGIISPEFNRKFDYTHYRNSGLNHILIKIAKEKNKLIIENLSFLNFNLNKQEKARILGRIIQNYSLANQILKKNLDKIFIFAFIVDDINKIKKSQEIKELSKGFLIKFEK